MCTSDDMLTCEENVYLKRLLKVQRLHFSHHMPVNLAKMDRGMYETLSFLHPWVETLKFCKRYKAVFPVSLVIQSAMEYTLNSVSQAFALFK